MSAEMCDRNVHRFTEKKDGRYFCGDCGENEAPNSSFTANNGTPIQWRHMCQWSEGTHRALRVRGVHAGTGRRMSVHECDERCTNPLCDGGYPDWDGYDEPSDPADETLGMWVDERIAMYAENLSADELYDPAHRQLGDAA